jgi:hypothetical protein
MTRLACHGHAAVETTMGGAGDAAEVATLEPGGNYEF